MVASSMAVRSAIFYPCYVGFEVPDIASFLQGFQCSVTFVMVVCSLSNGFC